jgi:hypothetical protein
VAIDFKRPNRATGRLNLPKTVNADGLIPVQDAYNTREAAYLFGISWSTMDKWMRRHLIPSIRLLGRTDQERQYRIRHRALMAWLVSHPEYLYILDRLEGDVDQYEPNTWKQKAQEKLHAIARSPKPHEPIPTYRPPAPKSKTGRPRGRPRKIRES